jgi:plasmid stability protein
MATIQVRDVPDDVHAELRTRAAAAGMSLQEYLRGELIAAAQTRTPAQIVMEVAAERHVRGNAGYSAVSSASFIRADRDDR